MVKMHATANIVMSAMVMATSAHAARTITFEDVMTMRHERRVQIWIMRADGGEAWRLTESKESVSSYAAELVFYPRQGHGLSEYYHQLDRLNRQFEWITKHTLGDAARNTTTQ